MKTILYFLTALLAQSSFSLSCTEPVKISGSLEQHIKTLKKPVERLNYLLNQLRTLTTDNTAQTQIIIDLFDIELENFKQEMYENYGKEVVDQFIANFWTEADPEIENSQMSMIVQTGFENDKPQTDVITYKPYLVNASFENKIRLKNTLELLIAVTQENT